MRRTSAFLLVLCLVLPLAGCARVMHGTDALIAKAREEMPIADAGNADIAYAGLIGSGEYALIWFISGNAYQDHFYLPMECRIVGRDAYTFVHSYKAYDRGRDIAALPWRGGYAFLVNNPNCKTIRLTDGNGTRDIRIEKDAYPFLYYSEQIPSEYCFLDGEGKQIPE